MATRASIREKKAANKQGRQNQEDVMLELKKRQRAIHDKKVMNPDDMYHGALEDILLGQFICITDILLGQFICRSYDMNSIWT